MQHTIGVRKLLIYRCSLIFCFALSMGCGQGRCSGNKTKRLQAPPKQAPSDLQVPSKKTSASQRHKPKGADQPKEGDQPNAPDHLKPQKIKKVKRVAKVEEDQQAIVLLHGLNRLSYDFDKMKAVLQQKFPHATIVALKSVDKDSSKKGNLSPLSSLSTLKSIQEQAALAYEEIKMEIGRGKHVVIVGHSQGGLRGFTLIKEYRSRLKREKGISIDHLITIGTPWKGAPVMENIKSTKEFMEEFKKIENTLNAIHKNYGRDVIKYFFKIKPELVSKWPRLCGKIINLNWIRDYTLKKLPGVVALEPGSEFIRNYVALGLKETDLPITAIAGVSVDFSKLFEPFPSSIGPKELAELNATYAKLIGNDPQCEHDMLLPVSIQHAEGLAKKDFKCIKVEGTCHGNKVGISVKKGLSELNNEQVIQKVVECIEATFYEEKEEFVIEEEPLAPAA